MTSLCLCQFTDELIAYGILDRSSKISSAKRILGSLPSTGLYPKEMSANFTTLSDIIITDNTFTLENLALIIMSVKITSVKLMSVNNKVQKKYRSIS